MRRLRFAAFVAALTSTMLLGSCILACGCSPPPGSIRVEVRTPADAPVADVPVEHRSRYTRTSVRPTGADGVVRFTADSRQEHIVRVLPPDGHTLPAGEADTRRLRVDINQDTTVRFTLLPR